MKASRLLVLVAAGAALASSASARPVRHVRTSAWSTGTYASKQPGQDNNGALDNSSYFVPTPASTSVVSYNFNGPSCNAQGWTSADISAPTGDYVHVDDFAGGPWGGTSSQGGTTFSAINGTKSLWIGAAPNGADPVLCGYATLPGYGNNWNQSFCSTACASPSGGPTTDLDVAFSMKYDTEASYDAVSLEYSACNSNVWIMLDGGMSLWSGQGDFTVSNQYTVLPPSVKIRFRFTSDASWSSQDGMYNGFGVAIDDLSWETFTVEDFETTPVGAHATTDWQSCNSPGYGNYLALFKKTTGASYEDQCLDDLGCYWAAIQGSTEFYTCGTPPFPTQKIVPHVNVRGEYIANEIWSPVIPFTAFSGTGNEFRLRYTVYRDLPLDNLVFTVWHVRTIKGGCAEPWKDPGFVYFGDGKDWAISENDLGTMLDPYGQSMQVAIGLVDMCRLWCGRVGTGQCHSPAPYIDQVKILRINSVGPVWNVNDVHTFNDTFATDGTITGTARADIAMDILPADHPGIVPGDSAVVLTLVDHSFSTGVGTLGVSGLSNDPNLSTFAGRDKQKKAAYIWVTVLPFNPAKSGAALSDGPGGSANRYPFVGTQVIKGFTWTKLRMDYTYEGQNAIPGIGTGTQPRIDSRFNVDLNDNLFTPGDTIFYFYGATSPGGTTYFAPNFGTSTSINDAALNAQEFTILPAGGYNRGGDILYIDGADGSGTQPHYDGPFLALHWNDKVDRFDVRGAYAGVSNRPSSRVSNVAAQLNACYQTIIWDCGDLPITLGDGTLAPEKTDDYGLLNVYLAGASPFPTHGVYLCGDDVASALNGYQGASAVLFRTFYMPFTLLTGNHRLSPTFLSVSPSLIHTTGPSSIFTKDAMLFGGCPTLNDFDVLAPSGSSVTQMTYGSSGGPAAVLSHIAGDARVILGGYSFGYVTGGEVPHLSSPANAPAVSAATVTDPTQLLYDMFAWFGGAGPPPTGSGPLLANSLAQNYPNPFNPQTTIAFSIRTRGTVMLKVYNAAGQLVRTLVNEPMTPGSHTREWDGRNNDGQPVSSGVYFYQLKTADFSRTKKMVLLK